MTSYDTYQQDSDMRQSKKNMYDLLRSAFPCILVCHHQSQEKQCALSLPRLEIAVARREQCTAYTLSKAIPLDLAEDNTYSE